MFEDEYPLLNYPDLMEAVLKVAAGDRGAAGLGDAEARLLANLRLAGEEPRMGEAELRRRLARARRYLIAGRLIEPAGDEDRFRITERGRQVLAAHPRGVDDSVLMEFPEFRAFIHEESGAPAAEARATVFDSGYSAYFRGATPADNPYDFDTGEHLAWENGWFEARDEDSDHRI